MTRTVSKRNKPRDLEPPSASSDPGKHACKTCQQEIDKDEEIHQILEGHHYYCYCSPFDGRYHGNILVDAMTAPPPPPSILRTRSSISSLRLHAVGGFTHFDETADTLVQPTFTTMTARYRYHCQQEHQESLEAPECSGLVEQVVCSPQHVKIVDLDSDRIPVGAASTMGTQRTKDSKPQPVQVQVLGRVDMADVSPSPAPPAPAISAVHPTRPQNVHHSPSSRYPPELSARRRPSQESQFSSVRYQSDEDPMDSQYSSLEQVSSYYNSSITVDT